MEGPFANTARTPLKESKVAPGVEVVYIISFSPNSNQDFNHDLIVLTEREKFLVPIRARGARAQLALPDAVDFGSVPVKRPVKRTFVMHNEGEKPTKFLLSTQPMQATSIAEATQAETEFTVSPDHGSVPPGGSVAVSHPQPPPSNRRRLMLFLDRLL